MKIIAVEPITVRYPEPNDAGALRQLCLVKLTADDGQVGWGEAVTMWPEASKATAVLIEGMAPLLLGRDPVHSDAIWRSLRDHSWWYGAGGIANFAISALDIAVWDLKGKALGRSVLDLLGGPITPRLPAIASSHAFLPEVDQLAEEAAGFLATGLHGIKVGWGKKGASNLGFEHDRDVAFVRAVRDAIGPEKSIIVDLGVNHRWDLATAVRRTRALEEYGLTWIEEPLGADDPAGYPVLKAKTTTLIALGEREWGVRQYQRLLETSIVDVVGVDPGRAEGITGFMRIVQLAEAAGRQVNAHAWSSAIISAASLAVSFTSPAFHQFEVKPIRNPMQHDLVSQPIDHEAGWMTPLLKPGLGIEVREEVVEGYRW